MIHVLHVVNAFDVGGMENGLVNVINYSRQTTFQHSVCSLTTEGKMKERVVPDVNYYALNKVGVERFLFVKMRTLLKKSKPDVVHIRGWGPFFDTIVSTMFLPRAPKVIFSFHGMSYGEYISPKKFSDVIKENLLWRVNQIMTLNTSMSQYLCSRYHIRKDSIKIIGNGVDAAIFSPYTPNQIAIAELKRALGIRKDDFVIGTVGRLEQIKNMKFLINACSGLKEKIPGVKLLIVGEGTEQKDLSQMCRELHLEKHVIFTGKQDDMYKMYRLMNIYVQSSLYEGFSNTILEAMASGLPVVCTNVGGNQDLVIHGENGYLFEVDNYHEFANHLNRLYENVEVRHTFSVKSRQLVEESWTIDRMAKNYEAMYSALCGQELSSISA
ncbi:MAG: glycosyltransferase family 4 protein [Lentisphaerae bacterium]|nr:glycosyltransferase family 4 protein [Lentisphaerota bacterium]